MTPMRQSDYLILDAATVSSFLYLIVSIQCLLSVSEIIQGARKHYRDPYSLARVSNEKLSQANLIDCFLGGA